MSDGEKLKILEERLRVLERQAAPSWQRPILDVARCALECEIAELGRRIVRRTFTGSRGA